MNAFLEPFYSGQLLTKNYGLNQGIRHIRVFSDSWLIFKEYFKPIIA